MVLLVFLATMKSHFYLEFSQFCLCWHVVVWESSKIRSFDTHETMKTIETAYRGKLENTIFVESELS